MSDNTQLNQATTSGDVIRTLDRVSAKTQVVGLDIGQDTGRGGEQLVGLGVPLPVAINDTDQSQAADNPAYQTLVGDPSGDYAGLSLLELVMNANSGEALNVNIVSPPAAQDALGAAMVSDAVALKPYYYNAVGATNILGVIDTKGYGALSLEVSGTWSGAISVYASNDLVQWTLVNFINEQYPLQQGNQIASINGTFIFSTRTGRYFQIKALVTTTPLIINPVLRRDPVTLGTVVGLSQIGTASISAIGSAQTTFGVPVGGAGPTNLATMLQTDANGAVNAGGVLPVGYSFGNYNRLLYGYSAPIAASILTAAQSVNNPVQAGGGDPQGFARRLLTDRNGAAMVSQEAPTSHGQSVVDLLTQMVALLRVNNFYLSELYRVDVGATDDPDSLLNDYITQLAN